VTYSRLIHTSFAAKANWFLEQMIELADEPLDSRTMQYLLSKSETRDGGQYDMAVSLVQTYGLVPQLSQSIQHLPSCASY
jgi:bleomycin hydrolase